MQIRSRVGIRCIVTMPIHGEGYVETNVAARLDRLPWSRWHWLIVTALGITWVLDGLEATLGSAPGGTLKESSSM